MREIIWTYDKCKLESLKYKTRVEFKKGSPTAYKKCTKNKWIELFEHMVLLNKPKGYWTYDRCKEEALKYSMRFEFSSSVGWAYNTARMNGWLDDVCRHMVTVGNYKKRCVYAYEFSDTHVYIGLTLNFEQRWNKRMLDKNDIVKIYIDETKINPIRIKLTDYIDKDEASYLEGEFLEKYKEKGWIVLNRNKTGSIGGNVIKYTRDFCKIEALKYKSFLEFRSHNGNCLAAIYKNKWNDLLSHLSYKKLPNGYWTLEKCIQESLNCKSRTDFYKKCRGGYASAIKNNWMDVIFKK